MRYSTGGIYLEKKFQYIKLMQLVPNTTFMNSYRVIDSSHMMRVAEITQYNI